MSRNGADVASKGRPAGSAVIGVDDAGRVPLATQISRQITQQVATGRIAAGSDLPSMTDLARQLGVNVHTVRAAYRQLAEDGIVSMARGARTRVVGYDRRLVAGGADAPRSFTIGVLMSAFDLYCAEYLDALTDEAELTGCLPIICRTQNYRSDVVERYMDQLFSRNVDGIILIHFENPGDVEVVDTFVSSARLRPFVLVDCADIGVGSRIALDHAADAYSMTAHLIEDGHVRIGHLGAPEGRSRSPLLRSGYEQALAAAGIPPDGDLVAFLEDFSLEAGAKAMMRLLQQDDPPTAVMCVGDAPTFGVMAAARELGVRVPADLAVMGYGGIPLSHLASTRLSMLQIPAAELGREAVRTLRRMIETGEIQPPVTISTRFVPRESSGRAADQGTRTDRGSARLSATSADADGLPWLHEQSQRTDRRRHR